MNRNFINAKIAALLSLFMSLNATAQEWSRWVSLDATPLDLSISFKIKNNCSPNGGGYSFFRFNNNTYSEKGSAHVTFEYIDCDGEKRESGQTFLLKKTGIDESTGYWFLTDGSRVTNIRVDELYIPEKKIWLKRDKDNKVVDLWKKKNL